MKLLAGTHSVNKTIIYHRSLLYQCDKGNETKLLKVTRNTVWPKMRKRSRAILMKANVISVTMEAETGGASLQVNF